MLNRFAKIILVGLFCAMFITNVCAVDKTQFKTVPLSCDQKRMIWNNIKITPISDDNHSKNDKLVMSFDVSNNENILLGMEGNKIVVIDEIGTYMFGFTFENDGDFYVRWAEENILLMIVRGSVIVEFTPAGELIDIVATDVNDVNNIELWNSVKEKEIVVGDKRYICENRRNIFLCTAQSQLIKLDNAGVEKVIYCADTLYSFGVMLWITSIGVLALFILIKKKQSDEKNWTVSVKT